MLNTVKVLYSLVSKAMCIQARLIVVPKGGNAYDLLDKKLVQLGLEKIHVSLSTVFELGSPNVRGMYFPELDVLLVKDQQDLFANLSVVVHECRHVWQKQQGWIFPVGNVQDSYNHPVEVDARKFTSIVVDVIGYTSTLLTGYAIGMVIRQILGLNKKGGK
jgi:hypothetical protein